MPQFHFINVTRIPFKKSISLDNNLQRFFRINIKVPKVDRAGFYFTKFFHFALNGVLHPD